ncbi:hypothetical protein C0Q70_02905 [Pomacea canaliculata]|uniref:Uncharacterized protein n=1 Tax=Pomacea canaliculata TaxID=400727 RepID=A0A2T7PR78_POMCA|nr:hypothetical protein C0Q70_02905 [Pomacea canaliculata]
MVEMARMGSTESIVARCGGYGFRDDMHVEENVLIFKAPPPLLPKCGNFFSIVYGSHPPKR